MRDSSPLILSLLLLPPRLRSHLKENWLTCSGGVLPTHIADIAGVEWPDTMERTDQILGSFKLSNDRTLSPRPSPSAYQRWPMFLLPFGTCRLDSARRAPAKWNQIQANPQAVSEAQPRPAKKSSAMLETPESSAQRAKPECVYADPSLRKESALVKCPISGLSKEKGYWKIIIK